MKHTFTTAASSNRPNTPNKHVNSIHAAPSCKSRCLHAAGSSCAAEGPLPKLHQLHLAKQKGTPHQTHLMLYERSIVTTPNSRHHSSSRARTLPSLRTLPGKQDQTSCLNDPFCEGCNDHSKVCHGTTTFMQNQRPQQSLL